MNNKIFKDFYGENNELEVCLILFDKCNLHCKFCFEDHNHIISTKEIINISNKLIPQLEEVIKKRSYINKFIFRLWGGELFMDGISDEYFTAYTELVNRIKNWCNFNNYKYEFCFSTNLVFNKIDRVKNFIKNNENSYIATSYDPVSRFHSKEIENIWWKNIEIFNPKVISITLTKPAIDKYIKTDILFKLSKFELYPEYYIYNKDWRIYAPKEEELFEFLKFCYINDINIPEIKSMVYNYKNNISSRYCFCYNSCSFINERLVFSCLLRSGTLDMISEYGMTLDECYDNDHCTEKQFFNTISKLKCLNCKFYNICRLPCMASKMHKNVETNICHLKLFYNWIKNQ